MIDAIIPLDTSSGQRSAMTLLGVRRNNDINKRLQPRRKLNSLQANHDFGGFEEIFNVMSYALSKRGLPLFQTSPGFYVYCSTSLLKTLFEKENEKLLVTSNFSFFQQCFLPISRTFCIFHEI